MCVHACLCVCKCLCSIRMCLCMNVYVWGDVASRRRKQGVKNSLETGAVGKNSKKLVSWGPSWKPMSFQSRNLSLSGNVNRGLTAQGPSHSCLPHRHPQAPIGTDRGRVPPGPHWHFDGGRVLDCSELHLSHHIPEFSVDGDRSDNENLGHAFSNCFLSEARNNFSLD